MYIVVWWSKQSVRISGLGRGEGVWSIALLTGLTAKLLRYQKKAVAWMLEQERGKREGRGEREAESGMERREGEGENSLHPLWTKLPSLGEFPPVYFNYHSGRYTY